MAFGSPDQPISHIKNSMLRSKRMVLDVDRHEYPLQKLKVLDGRRRLLMDCLVPDIGQYSGFLTQPMMISSRDICLSALDAAIKAHFRTLGNAIGDMEKSFAPTSNHTDYQMRKVIL